MSLYLNIITLKDRIKLRLLLDEADDLRRDLFLCLRGSDAWLALHRELRAVNENVRQIGERLAMRGYVGTGVASNLEITVAAAVALALCVIAYIVVAA